MRKQSLTILAIETSCDETAIAVVKARGGFQHPRFEILANIVASQVKLHAKWGGVVPNLAKREHIKNLPIVLARALKKARITHPEKKLDAIAVTAGPGLEPALWTGITCAKNLAEQWNLPGIAVNHMEGHITAVVLPKSKIKNKKSKLPIQFPALALLVSGGHTELVLIKQWLDYTVIGSTLDDAAGEAFDKVARMLDLGYPGGPHISRLARTGSRMAFPFPRPMIHTKNFDFSFSGLKTAVLYTLRELKEKKAVIKKEDIAASFENAVVDVLVKKTLRAIQETNARSLILGGGVAANTYLRAHIVRDVQRSLPQCKIFLPAPQLTTDNAAMIGAAAYFHVLKKQYVNWNELHAHATLDL